MMSPIGWTLTCVLFAVTVSKNPLLVRSEPDGLSETLGEGRGKVTKLLPIHGENSIDPDILELRQFLDDLFNGGNEVQDVESRGERTFGHKRIQFMLMPMMYKMGVMMTMLTVLTVISLKGLLIGAVLLILKLSTVIAKFSTGWHTPHAQAWPGQPIHVHVHNSLPTAHSQAYSGWIPDSGPGDEEHYYYKG